jgi:hypothetical protein
LISHRLQDAVDLPLAVPLCIRRYEHWQLCHVECGCAYFSQYVGAVALKDIYFSAVLIFHFYSIRGVDWLQDNLTFDLYGCLHFHAWIKIPSSNGILWSIQDIINIATQGTRISLSTWKCDP